MLVAAVFVLASPIPAEAAKVSNPGVGYAVQFHTGFLQIRAEAISFEDAGRLPECSDGVNNNDSDQDSVVDFPADPQCTSATDDSELVGGFQPKQPIQLTNGTIDAGGAVTFPTSGVSFPQRYTYVNASAASGGLVNDFIVTKTISAVAPMTGSVNPLTGHMSLRMQLRIDFDGGPLDSACRIDLVDVNSLITGTTAPPGPNTPITGSPYDPASRLATLVNNSFAVPGAQGCGSAFFGAVNFNDEINNTFGLPSPAGLNAARFAGEFVTTGPLPAIVPSFTTLPASGPAPLTVGFDAAASVSSQPVATYQWDFTNDGSFDASGITTANGYSTPGTYTARLRVTDVDGDFAETTRTVTVLSNLAPTASDQSVSLAEDTAQPIMLTGTDPEGGPLTFALAPPWALHGTVSGTPPNVTYTPAPDYHGPDSFGFTVTDSAGASDTGLVTLTVVQTSYDFGGFLWPVDPDGLTRAIAGLPIPIRFSLGGDRGLNVFEPGSPTVQQVRCSDLVAIGAAEPATTFAGVDLYYHADTDSYVYLWKTRLAWAGSCRRFEVAFADGTTATAVFDFRFRRWTAD